jgi:5-methylthioribose kinase
MGVAEVGDGNLNLVFIVGPKAASLSSRRCHM